MTLRIYAIRMRNKDQFTAQHVALFIQPITFVNSGHTYEDWRIIVLQCF